jgi:hypothetical protein
MADKRFRRKLASWIRPNRTKSRDGIPGYRLAGGEGWREDFRMEQGCAYGATS